MRYWSLALISSLASCVVGDAPVDPADDGEGDGAADSPLTAKPVCLPRTFTFGTAPAPDTVRVMTYNIRLGASGTPSDDTQPDDSTTTFFAPDPHAKAKVDEICAHLRELADVIASENPDVVSLQEVDEKFSDRSAKLYEARELATMLGMHYTFAARKKGYGIAMLWRASLDAKLDATITLADGQLDSDNAKQVVAVVDFPGLDIRAAATHLSGSSADLRNAAAATIKAEPELATPTTVLFGDMNSAATSPDYPDLVAGRHDALPDLGITTVTVKSPLAQYDHVFLGSSILAEDAHIIPTRTITHGVTPYSHSDHSVVVVNLRHGVHSAAPAH
jgi:endonuclease/exonuclease/phosphatase family metal-dependent hydrolase